MHIDNTDLPLDEYDNEAKMLYEYLIGADSLPSATDISRQLTAIVQRQMEYDFTEQQMEDGVFPSLGVEVHRSLISAGTTDQQNDSRDKPWTVPK